MSAVYLALEVDGGRAVALKVLGGKYAVRADARPRLLAEQTYTQAMAGHPGIIPVLYAGTLPEADGAPFSSLSRRTRNTVLQWLRDRTKAFRYPDDSLPVTDWLAEAGALIEASRTPCPVCSECPAHGRTLPWY